MAKVVKVINNVRTTELDALSDAMEREYAAACADGATAVAGNIKSTNDTVTRRTAAGKK